MSRTLHETLLDLVAGQETLARRLDDLAVLLQTIRDGKREETLTAARAETLKALQAKMHNAVLHYWEETKDAMPYRTFSQRFARLSRAFGGLEAVLASAEQIKCVETYSHCRLVFAQETLDSFDPLALNDYRMRYLSDTKRSKLKAFQEKEEELARANREAAADIARALATKKGPA